MHHNDICNALHQLGYVKGFVVVGDVITIWENTEPKPTQLQLENALELWQANKLEQDVAQIAAKANAQAKLAALGLTTDDLAALGL